MNYQQQSNINNKQQVAVGPGGSPRVSPVLTVIEWEMLDKKKFFPLSMMSSFTVRCFLYPLTLIRTRLQVQKGKEVYTGTFDAGRKIVQTEGVRGLYRGFLVSTVQIVSGLCYVSMYEWSRHILDEHNVTNKTKAFISGGLASITTETFAVPLDVITQHMMLMGLAEKEAKGKMSHVTSQEDKLRNIIKSENMMVASKFTKSTVPQFVTDHTHNIQSAAQSFSKSASSINIKSLSKRKSAQDVIVSIYKKDGIKGYYRGYTASVCMFAPSSACWWTFYQFTKKMVSKAITVGIPLQYVCLRLVVHVGGHSINLQKRWYQRLLPWVYRFSMYVCA